MYSKQLRDSRKEIPGQGFTLIELIVTVAIVATLASIAYPSYLQYVVRSNRSAVESFMLGVSNQQEQYILDARAYATSLGQLFGSASDALATPPDIVRHYTVTVSAANGATPPTYTITATPIGTQATRDILCGTLSLTSLGIKDKTGTGTVAKCW